VIKLINGRGQLGEALKKIIGNENIDAIIYHTWNFQDKSEEVQRKCFKDLKKFVDENSDSRIIFISTILDDGSPYARFKRISELFIADNKNGSYIRLPTMIGKGVCEKFRDGNIEPFGDMELISLEDAAKEVIEFAKSDKKEKIVKGTILPAKLVKNLILFGKGKK
jgi:hypothetical protein